VGQALPLDEYRKCDEALFWAHCTLWADAEDPTLRRLSRDLQCRRLPKCIAIDPNTVSKQKLEELKATAIQVLHGESAELDPRYFIADDTPARQTYKTSTWNEGFDGAVKLMGADGKITALEQDPLSVVKVLDQRKPYPSLIVPAAARPAVLEAIRARSAISVS
jgi:hypothetical protein